MGPALGFLCFRGYGFRGSSASDFPGVQGLKGKSVFFFLLRVLFCCGCGGAFFFLLRVRGRVFFFAAGAGGAFFFFAVGAGALFFCCGCRGGAFFFLRVRSVVAVFSIFYYENLYFL